jgi:HK97 family phage prohead protease
MTTNIKLDQVIRLTPVVEVKLANAAKGVVEGYASTFGGEPDAYGDIVAPGAYARTLAEHKAAGTLPVFLWSHDPARPIGRWDQMVEDAKGLRVVGQLNRETTAGRDAFEHMKAGDATGLSIGFSVAVDGREYEDDGTATLTDIELWEVSAVTLPANRNARVTGVKSVSIQSQRELETLLHEAMRLPRAAAKKVAAGGWPALANAEQTDMEAIADMLRKSAAKHRRIF